MNSGLRDVERPPRGLAAAHGDDLGARGERVQPLGRRGHSGADDRDARRVLVRLVGVHGARVALELGRPGQAGVAGGEQDVAEDAVPVELEAAVHGSDALDPGPPEALVPAAARPQLVDVGQEELDASAGSGRRR